MQNQKDLTEINVPSHGNELLEKVQQLINENEEIFTLWRVTNVVANDRLGWPDHGPVHFQIVANIALRITRLLLKNNVDLSVTTNFGLSHQYGELIVFLGSLLHDLGMSVNREGHEEFSLFIANNLLREMLDFLPVKERTIVTSEVLHSIISHRSSGRPLTVEAGIVRVSDALDLAKGRSMVPFKAGIRDIHSVSTAAIDRVEISEGDERPVHVDIIMSNSAGLFQVDDLLNSKLSGSGIEKYVTVRAYIEGESEKKLLNEFVINK